ncbi:MAG: FAD-dependent monooxygenase, partial [Alphaproteobacteria bacterium]|nr:FAD-dependent monooxygenase [Alphaproteobacteria bacterium]
QKMLSHLNLWSFSAEDSTKITEILVSQKSFGTDCFDNKNKASSLRFSLDGEPMAWTIENNSLLQSCYELNLQSPSRICVYEGALSFDFSPLSVTITDSKGAQWQAELLIACDGAHSHARTAAGLSSTSLAAHQKAVIARINLNRFHNNKAFQRFLPDGPIALMPIKAQEAALVWSATNKVADTLSEMSDSDFTYQVREALGDGFSALTIKSKRGIWPLNPSITRSMGQPGLLLAGDSSHSIHPLAGMGFNLALGDIAVICDCLDSARNNGLSFSHPSILTDYQAKRRVEIEAIIGVTQGLNRLFSHKSFQLKLLPSGLIDLGLGVMDMLPIKKQLTQIATGGVLTSARLFSDI